MRPRLIHPVNVTIQRVDQTSTQWDETFREPVDGADVQYHPPETIRAQVSFSDFERRQMAAQGDDPVTSGYMIYKRGAGLKKGDKIMAVDGMPIEAYIISVEPAAATRSGYALELATFQERRKTI